MSGADWFLRPFLIIRLNAYLFKEHEERYIEIISKYNIILLVLQNGNDLGSFKEESSKMSLLENKVGGYFMFFYIYKKEEPCSLYKYSIRKQSVSLSFFIRTFRGIKK